MTGGLIGIMKGHYEGKNRRKTKIHYLLMPRDGLKDSVKYKLKTISQVDGLKDSLRDG